jgi:Flp pilus assembly pilin Flp
MMGACTRLSTHRGRRAETTDVTRVRNDEAQDLVEYAFLLAFLALCIVAGLQSFGIAISATYADASSVLATAGGRGGGNPGNPTPGSGTPGQAIREAAIQAKAMGAAMGTRGKGPAVVARSHSER